MKLVLAICLVLAFCMSAQAQYGSYGSSVKSVSYGSTGSAAQSSYGSAGSQVRRATLSYGSSGSKAAYGSSGSSAKSYGSSGSQASYGSSGSAAPRTPVRTLIAARRDVRAERIAERTAARRTTVVVVERHVAVPVAVPVPVSSHNCPCGEACTCVNCQCGNEQRPATST